MPSSPGGLASPAALGPCSVWVSTPHTISPNDCSPRSSPRVALPAPTAKWSEQMTRTRYDGWGVQIGTAELWFSRLSCRHDVLRLLRPASHDADRLEP